MSLDIKDINLDLEAYETQGFTFARGLFSPTEVAQIKAHFMDLWAQGKGFFEREQKVAADDDPLKRYPRMVHPHRWDELSLQFLLDERIRQCLVALLNEEPYAVQTMFYFKPAGARGQALHQDQAPLRVQPGTCMAAWMAVDRCDEENGCLLLVPGSQNLPLLCSVEADLSLSFSGSMVPLPDGMEPIPAIMEPGDVLFFNGQVIHGSFPNSSQDRFRRSLIGHYIVAEAEKVGEFYHPILRFDGSEVELGITEGSTPCGVWVEKDGVPVVEIPSVAASDTNPPSMSMSMMR
jgi:ectoine hydroxylase-related dioxygenase (phytanoyl-CoA dioxygenase family)